MNSDILYRGKLTVKSKKGKKRTYQNSATIDLFTIICSLLTKTYTFDNVPKVCPTYIDIINKEFSADEVNRIIKGYLRYDEIDQRLLPIPSVILRTDVTHNSEDRYASASFTALVTPSMISGSPSGEHVSALLLNSNLDILAVINDVESYQFNTANMDVYDQINLTWELELRGA